MPLSAQDLEVRARVERWLVRLQNLEGFDERLADLAPPEASLALSLRQLLAESHQGVDDGIARYLDRLSDVQQDLFCNARWAARAVHDAVRRQSPVQLPDLAGEAWLTTPTKIPVFDEPGISLPASHWFDFAEELERAAGEIRAAVVAVSGSAAADRPDVKTVRLSDTNLDHALEAAEFRLRRRTVPDNLRQGASRATAGLEFAVYGTTMLPEAAWSDDLGVSSKKFHYRRDEADKRVKSLLKARADESL